MVNYANFITQTVSVCIYAYVWIGVSIQTLDCISTILLTHTDRSLDVCQIGVTLLHYEYLNFWEVFKVNFTFLFSIVRHY